jgi:hypothetical protein
MTEPTPVSLPMVDTKPLYQSKTFYLNLIAAILPLFPVVSAWVAENQEIYMAAWATLATVLRLITKDKVTLV